MSRIAIVDNNKCKPNKCKKECIAFCPPQKSGKEVIKIVTDIEDLGNVKKMKAEISEILCIGCNICVKKCPFDAVKIINLPIENKDEIIHRYSINSFRLYRFPILKKGIVLGIVGQNGIGKSTIINILSNIIKPNFEIFNKNLTEKEILQKFKGSVMLDYFKNLYNKKLSISIKQQNLIPNDNFVLELINQNNIDIENNNTQYLLTELNLNHLLNNNIKTLSGGELQRLLCFITLSQNSDLYIFDEPSNFLDVKQRLIVVKLIRQLVNHNKYIIVIDHDLSMLDYVSDEINIVYGYPGAFGIISKQLTVLEGLNMYLDGFIPQENMRFRNEPFNLKPLLEIDNDNIISNSNIINYDGTTIKYDGYELEIPNNNINLYGINVILGENGNGKTTYIKYLISTITDLRLSFKDQMSSINGIENLTITELFINKILTNFTNDLFKIEIIKPLINEELMNKKIKQLSGGELQKVMIILCLGTDADIYLLDEPSANLDIESRLLVLKIIKKFIASYKKCVFVIEHDIMMAVSFAQEIGSKILMIEKEIKDNIRYCKVSDYMNFNEGINKFLKSLDITMRISSHNRPRINKHNSRLDSEQKYSNNYYA